MIAADSELSVPTLSDWYWYESGTWIPMMRCEARITRSVELVVPIHHGGDGEAAGEGLRWS